MVKIINFFFLILFLIFFFITFKYYSSNKNISNKDYNRVNIDEILKEKLENLPILDNNTNNVIEFNSGFSNEIINEKKRSFWNLLKN